MSATYGLRRRDRERKRGRSTRAGRRREQRRRRRGRWRTQLPFWAELPLLVVIAVVLALVVKTFLIQAFYIPSGSMQHTLEIGDRVLVNKLVYHVRAPRRGEVVVFNGVHSWTPESAVSRPGNPLARVLQSIGSAVGVVSPGQKDFVKRVIGVPGDTVACCDARGRVTVDGHPLSEPYIDDNSPIESRSFGPVTVPPGRLWVMGDHRRVSADSRVHIDDQWEGTIPENQVIGRASLVVWPPRHLATLPVRSTLGSVPAHRSDGSAPLVGLPLATTLPVAMRGRRRRRASV